MSAENFSGKSSETFSIRLTGKNYSAWEFQFRMFLKGKTLWNHIDGSSSAPTDATALSQWETKDACIISWILASIEPRMVNNLRSFGTAKQMWDYLRCIYHQENAARRFQLELEISQFGQGNLSIEQYYSEFINLWSEYSGIIYSKVSPATLGGLREIHEESMRDKFLMKLRPEFETARAGLLNRNPVPSLDICVGELLREEQRMATQAVLSGPKETADLVTLAYAAQGRNRGKGQSQCYSCKEFGHIARNCSKKFCNYCKQQGHIIKECPTRPEHRKTQAFQAAVSSSSINDGTAAATQANQTPLTPEMVQQMIINAFSALGLQMFFGRVTYNGHELNEFVPQRTAAYVSQHDLHLGEMTVRETLTYSARLQGIGHRYEVLSELSRREKESNITPEPDLDVFMKAIATEAKEADVMTDYYLKILGLEVCADIMVGNEMLRGISGGQRKRVTTGEMMVGPSKALFMDEISTGLDSSTTFQIVNSIKHYIHFLNGTAVISLLQPAPETFDLFDDIILLSEGQIVYQGPRAHVLEFFEHMGFKCPERKGVADFLQEITSRKDQQQYWTDKEKSYRFVTVKEFSEAFQSFHVGRGIGDELSNPFDKTKSHPAALTTNHYGVGRMELFKSCFSRELLLMKRNSFVYIFKLCQLTIMAMIAMTLFLRTEMHRDSVADGGIFAGALFFSVTFIMFTSMPEISMTIARLPVFYKQRDLQFYPSWAFSLPSWILKIPITLLQTSVWVFLTYYVIGYDPNVGRLFKQYLLLAVLNQMASGLFRLIAATGRTMIVANTFGSFALLVLFALGGFVLSYDDIKKWWLWGYWISPLMYGQNAMMVNEFLGKSWSHVLPNSNETLGVEILKSRGFFHGAYWYWLGVGALVGFDLLFNFGYTLALTFLNPYQKAQAVMSKDSEDNVPSETGGEIQLSNHESGHQARTGSGRSNSNHFSFAPGVEISEAKRPKQEGMVLPFEPHSITFDNIKYSVNMPQEMKSQGVVEGKLELLKGVSGTFRPGVLTALMGVSGAGKTTLMDVLAGRKTGGYIEGNISISGYPKKQGTFARIAGYCEQNDIHSPHVTVYESLLYSAWLRLPAELNAETRKMFIEEVMELVELKPLRQALVGLPGVSGLSTEQRKRLTIAVELVANPSIIFMDEPTSGLDARAAAIVMRAVRNTVDTGRTVVCTIHQPSIDIFEAFDELFLMKRGGQEIYVGPLGHHSCHLIKYFEGIDGAPKIKDGYNPATWMLEVTSLAQESALGVDFAALYRNSALYQRNKSLIQELSVPLPDSKDLYFPTQYSTSFFSQCMACLWKQHLSYWHNPSYTAVRFLFTIAIAVIFGTMFWNLGSRIHKRQDLFNAMGSMFAAVIFLGIQNSSSVQPVVAVERTVFYRERTAGMYSPLPYAFAQVLIELPYILMQALCYGVIVYAMIGFEWTAAKFFWYIFFMYFTLMYFTFYGMMAVAATPNQSVAAIVSSGFYSLWNLFSGFVIPRPRIPVWWRWYTWICPVAWTLYGLIASQFGDMMTEMETGETVAEFVRTYFDFRHEFLGVVAAVVVGFAALFAFTFVMAIKFFNFQRR